MAKNAAQAGGNSTQEAGTGAGTLSTASDGQGGQFRVTPQAPVQGAPLPNLPNLDGIRTRRHLPPHAKPPVPSTRCSPHARGCSGNRSIVENSPDSPPDSHQALQLSSTERLELASNITFPVISSLLGMEAGALSDSPFSVKWPASLLSPALQSVGSSATFVKTDTTTQGNWKGRYGAEGYQIVGDSLSYPAYAQVTTGMPTYTWAASTSSVRALQKSSSSTDRVAACWYQSTDLTIDVNITDGKAHQIALYSLDWDSGNVRAQQVEIRDAATSAVLDSRSVRAFGDGIYLVWNVSGHVSIRVAQTGLVNSVVSALFFGPARTNVALVTNGGVASASSTTPDSAFPGSEFRPSAVNDGNRAGSTYPHNGFWRDNTADIYPDWVQVEFDSTRSIDEVDLFTVQDAIEANPVEPTQAQTFTLYGITRYDVQYWNGGSWATLPNGSVTDTNDKKVWRKLSFSPVSTNKIRVLVYEALFNQSRVVELEAYEATAPANVALGINGGAATASSTTSNNPGLYPGYNFSPAVATDGDRKSGVNFWRDNTPDLYPDWLQVQFAGLRNISEVDLFTLQNNVQNPVEPTPEMTFSLYGITDFKVEYWNGSAWAMLTGAQVTSDSTGNTNRVWRKFTFSPVATDRIRVLVSGALASYSRIVELEAYERAPATTGGSQQNGADELAMARLDAVNRTGTSGEDLLSGNYHWTLPLLSLPGRAGLDLGLSLSYNSLVWTRAGQTITFDADRGFPSPGFRIGFPTIEPLFYNSQTGKYAYLLVMPSGSRIELRQSATQPSLYESADSSHLELDASQMMLRSMDGTRLSYAFSGSAYHCTQVKDRNGNFISVVYDADGFISNVTETLGRTVTFNYYITPQGFNTHNLISITQARNGDPSHAVATFGYLPQDLTVQTSFTGLSITGAIQNGTTIPALGNVCLDDATCYNFSYTTWGQVTRIDHYVQDNVNTNNWILLNYVSYNLPANNSAPQSDCPRFTQKRVWAIGWNGDTDGVPASVEEAVSAYTIALQGTQGMETLPTVIYRNPNGSVNSTISVANRETFGAGWSKGLTVKVETFVNNDWARTNETIWTQDDTSLAYQLNPRPAETRTSDPAGNIRGTIINYGEYASYGLPYEVSEYVGAQKIVLRRTRTVYNLADIYKSRHIIGLIGARLLYNAGDAAPSSRIEYLYDLNLNQEYLQNQGAAVQHDGLKYPASFVEGRGNLTRIVRWNVSDNQAAVLESRMGYNTQGSLIFTRDPVGHQNLIGYTDSFADAGSHPATLAYPTELRDADGNISRMKYEYYLGAVAESTDPKGATTSNLFDVAGRIDRTSNNVNNSFKQFHYGPRYVVTFTSVKNLTEPVYAITWTDGLGQPYAVAKESPVPGASGPRYSAQVLVYDVTGKVHIESNPTEIEAGWIPTGDDVTGWQFTRQTFDWKGRSKVKIAPDGATTELIYGGCGCAGGETVETRDEVGRRQKATSDALGRPVKFQLFNPDGTDYSTVINTYDALDHLTNVKQYQGSVESGVYQETAMGYDGYGRLAWRKLPQQTTATVYSYFADDLLETETDARGVTRSYSYNGRHLLTGINYQQPLPAGVAETPNLAFAYDQAGNRTSMTEAGLGSVTYSYDQLSRLESEERSFAGLSGSFKLSYTYNLTGDLTSITDPFQSTVSYTRDHTGRTTSITGAGFGAVTQFASGLRYRAWGAVKHLTFGNQFSLDQTFTSRLQLLRSELHGAGQSGSSIAMGVENRYYDDGRIRFSQDLRSTADHLSFDRAFEYDHVARLSRALTGTEARGEGASDANPFRQVYSWDVWDHLTGRNDRHWERSYSFGDTYVNNRRVGWGYDAEGNLIEDEWTRHYDAASREVEQTTAEQSRKQSYDGDGEVLKRVEDGVTTYFVRSSVVGKVVTELNASAQPTSTFVYLDTEMIARYSAGLVKWEHYNPVTQSVMESNQSGAVTQLSERDPMGGDAGLTSPYEETGVGLPDFSFEYYQSPNDVGLGNPTNPRSGCNLDGMTVPCDYVAKQALNGAAEIASDMPQAMPLGFGGVLQQARITEEEPGGYYKLLLSPNLEFFQQPQNTGTRGQLTGDRLEAYKNARKRALEALKNLDCKNFLLQKLSLSAGAVAKAVSRQRAFDGLTSTISAADAGIVPHSDPLARFQVKDLFVTTNTPYIGALQAGFASREDKGARQRDVYYGYYGFEASTIIHETLHSLTGLDDYDLVQKLGGNISVELEKHGCV